MRKLLISMLCIIVSLAGLVGCKGNKKDTESDNSTPTESSTPSESTDSSSDISSLPSLDEYFGFESEILLPFQPFD